MATQLISIHKAVTILRFMVNALSQKGVFISTGSACSSKKVGNRILNSIGKSTEQIKQSIRVSFFETNTIEEVIEGAKIISEVYRQLLQQIKIKGNIYENYLTLWRNLFKRKQSKTF